MQDIINFLNYVNSTCWQDNTSFYKLEQIAQQVFFDITKNKTKQKKLYRLGGQTGSGKTTQLLFAVENYLTLKKQNPVVIGVRTCSKYHPRYEQIKTKVDKSLLREKTNGFALKCLGLVLNKLINNGYLIVLDLTFLDIPFEQFLLNMLTKNNYDIEYHIMAVNKQISNNFVNKRYLQTGRVIYKQSATYFNKVINKGLKYITLNDNKSNCYVWSVFSLLPVFNGAVCNCFKSYLKHKQIIMPLTYTEHQLKYAKLFFLLFN